MRLTKSVATTARAGGHHRDEPRQQRRPEGQRGHSGVVAHSGDERLEGVEMIGCGGCAEPVVQRVLAQRAFRAVARYEHRVHREKL